MPSVEQLEQENRVLRERIAQLERIATGQVDPVLRALIEHTPMFLNVVTPEGHFIATGRPSFGFGSVLGRSVYEFTNPEHHDRLRAALAQACETRQPVAYEAFGYSESGEPDHAYAVRAVPLPADGDVRAVLLIPLDITERVRLERSLAESEHAMRMAVEAACMGLWRWDVGANAVTWDARTCELFGVDKAPASYEEYLQLIHVDDRNLVGQVVQEARATGVYSTLEHRPANVSGRWLLAAGQVLREPDGRTNIMLGGVLDITEQKRLTTQMQRAERVEALGQLTAGIAHNFNNLLAAILPNVELALLEVPDSARLSLTAALDASLQARDLVKGLMSLAGRRGSAIHTEPSDPKDIVTRLHTLCALTFPKEIELQVSIEPLTGHVAMPASDLEQVLLNLLLNARDAVMEPEARARRIEVLVDRVVLGAGRGTVRIRVIDTGIGMSDAIHSQIFVPFFTTKPAHRGSGLGLANALTRVREAEGQLECESAPGAGTTFTLLLPELAAGMLRTLPKTQASAAPGAGTILLVDDEPMVRDVVARLLRKEQYTVLEAGSAAQARETLDRHGEHVRLILLDQSMPAESGVEALPSLRALCAAPIVLFTGLATEVPVGVAALLEKPARPAELLHAVSEFMRA